MELLEHTDVLIGMHGAGEGHAWVVLCPCVLGFPVLLLGAGVCTQTLA